MKTLHCADAGFDCKAVINANTEEEVLTQAAEHARTVHVQPLARKWLSK